jgi:hypothetical protein
MSVTLPRPPGPQPDEEFEPTADWSKPPVGQKPKPPKG